MNTFLRAFVALLALAAVAGGLAAYSLAGRGLSTRSEPGWLEATLARAMRRLAMPASTRGVKNPVAPSDAVMEEALTHFADHCASCHANDGSGNTPLGRSFYPPAPDMRLPPTQSLTDGELFSIIENGIRLTGMPAWGTGTPEGEHQSWALVHFVRRLSSLTPDDVARMEALNPRSPEEFRQQEEIRRFLAGEDEPASAAGEAAPPHKHQD